MGGIAWFLLFAYNADEPLRNLWSRLVPIETKIMILVGPGHPSFYEAESKDCEPSSALAGMDYCHRTKNAGGRGSRLLTMAGNSPKTLTAIHYFHLLASNRVVLSTVCIVPTVLLAQLDTRGFPPLRILRTTDSESESTLQVLGTRLRDRQDKRSRTVFAAGAYWI